MEVDRLSFYPLLPSMLELISNAHFVSFDLELSGIQSKQPFRAGATEGSADGKQSIQERYAETKEAAEKYQVLQVGITCIEQDIENSVYIARPFNFHLNPVMEEKLEVERIFSYQSGAVEFLMSHGFRMEAPFTQGVPYLSRNEEGLARKLALERQERAANIADIKIKTDDLDSNQFMDRVRNEIEAWRTSKSPKPDFLNIAPIGHDVQLDSRTGLTNFQKRLVHQIVRADYPELVTISKPQFIQVISFDKDREERIKIARAKRIDAQIARQTGLRWLFEAMVGGDLAGIDPRSTARNQSGDPVFVDLEATRGQLQALRKKLQDRPTVLVGHNLFTDLVNLYKCFFGNLPDRVEDFQKKIHELFPVIIDTKYVATYKTAAINPKSSLEEIDGMLSKEEHPLIETDSDHPKYLIMKPYHEAGYDSFLAAKVLIRLSAKLKAEQLPRDRAGHGSDYDDHQLSSEGEGGVSIRPKENTNIGQIDCIENTPFDAENKPEALSKVAKERKVDKLIERAIPSARKSKPKRAVKTMQPAEETVKSMFSHATRFDSLVDLPVDDDQDVRHDAADLTADSQSTSQRCSHPRSLMPPFEDDFWDNFANKLRVFGTVEERSAKDSSVCWSCRETISRRQNSSASASAVAEPSSIVSQIPPVTQAAAPQPAHALKAGVVLSRPPMITRDLTSFEKAYFFYQKRLNERLALPFTRYFYYKKGTPQDLDWKRKFKERQTPARDIGVYNAYSKEGWHDELLMGASESEPEKQVEALLKDAEVSSVGGDEVADHKAEVAEKPVPRITEADKAGDEKSLNRLFQRTLYLLVKGPEGRWMFPSSGLSKKESLHSAAERILVQSAGINMNTWVVGNIPIGHHNFKFPQPVFNKVKGVEEVGEKTFFMKARIMAGQANLAENQLGLSDFKWLSKEEIEKAVPQRYWSSVRDMLSDR
ncbi:CAF1-domain-containing protein [Xylona heveae TC161]|uniref:Large ribosomal subunit protein mL46 n=1 Tax=Xylona heveae (strain CBS 132557 / TC161) TaxID=1328760 RepID=A0A165FYC6_XYLHT|nr:CAF1-domain-containing protein [Xylona heveae TC161]KZF21529.1 CAF1-domain-containing protein [Xylona heveae TC161]